MTHRLFFVLASFSALSAAGCRQDPPMVRAYYSASCRLLSEPDCLESQDGSCSYTLAYPDQETCADELVDALGRCSDRAEAAVAAVKDDLDDCLRDLDALVCLSEDVCTPTPAMVAGSCSTVYQAILVACQE